MAGEARLVRRIVVAVDASAASLDALEAAAALAGRLGSELSGLFVEDEDLLRLAGLPFGELVLAPGGGRRPLDPGSAERALRAAAARAREALEETAARHGVGWSFRVSRGRVAREVVAAAEGADLVVLGAAGTLRPARGALGSTALAAAAEATTPVLLISRGTRLGGDAVALDDGTAAGARAVEVASALSGEGRAPAVVQPGVAGAEALAAAMARAGGVAVVPVERAEALVPRLLAAGAAVVVVR